MQPKITFEELCDLAHKHIKGLDGGSLYHYAIGQYKDDNGYSKLMLVNSENQEEIMVFKVKKEVTTCNNCCGKKVIVCPKCDGGGVERESDY